MIHAKAIIASKAELGANVEIGPYTIVEENVVIGDNTRIGAHSVIHSHTLIGSNNRIHEFVSLGSSPQIAHSKNNSGKLKIGDENVIREYVSMHRGSGDTELGTKIGKGNFIMAYCHIAHDCRIGNNSNFANGASLAGYVNIGDSVFLGGFTLVHQFCRIGRNSITGINTVVRQDIAPYVLVAGNPAKAAGINTRGLKKQGFSSDDISNLKKAYNLYFRKKENIDQVVASLCSPGNFNEHIAYFADFIKSSERGVVRSEKVS